MSSNPVKPVARWDTVPYQTFSGLINVGIVAFHPNGIDGVEFDVNGKATTVTAITYNRESMIDSYNFTLDARNYQDGPIAITAKVFPTAGVLRELPPLTLYANANRSLSVNGLWVSPNGNDANAGTRVAPFKTIEAATERATPGVWIYLAPGEYDFTPRQVGFNQNDRWITIQPDLYGFHGKTIIRPRGNQLRVARLRLFGLSIRCTVGNDLDVNPDQQPGSAIWLDSCDVSSEGVEQPKEILQPVSISWGGQYYTATAFHDIEGNATVNADLISHCSFHNIRVTPMDQPGLVATVHADGVGCPTNPNDHVDLIHWFSGYEGGATDANSIVTKLTAVNVNGQLLFSEGTGGIAVTDSTLWSGSPGKPGQTAFYSHLGRAAVDNVLLLRTALPDQAFGFDDGTAISNVVLRQCEFMRATVPIELQGRAEVDGVTVHTTDPIVGGQPSCPAFGKWAKK